jgi:hypothetical protein
VRKSVNCVDLRGSGNASRKRTLFVSYCVLAGVANSTLRGADTVPSASQRNVIGQEIAVSFHLQDGQEFSKSVAQLLATGKMLFDANWTEQEGGGRPLTKGTGRPLTDLSQPLTGVRSFNRISAPDANSCAGCHNMPYGISGGGGDFVTNVFVLGQRFDFATFDPADKLPTRGSTDEQGQPASLESAANLRATTGLFGAGYLEMLARQITEELQRIRDSIHRGQTKELVAKGIHYGKLTLTKAGLWDTSQVEGLPRLSLITTGSNNPPSLVIRPWHQAANVVSIREFSNNAFNQHHGIQSTERFGIDIRETDSLVVAFAKRLARPVLTLGTSSTRKTSALVLGGGPDGFATHC